MDENIDKLVYDFSEILTVYKTLPILKRNILKILAMFYDPIGLLQPVIINLKVLFQKFCKQKLNWAVDPPEEIKSGFKMFMADLENLNNISIPRKILFKNSDDPVELAELHGFSDASCQNYGACVYMRSITKNGVICVNLVASKSRLAPIKKTTIPRLELLENILLSKLKSSVKIFSTLKKLYRVTAWIFRFFNNLRKILSKTKTLSKPFITVCELKFAELFWIKENQKQFTDEKLKTLSKDLNLIKDENQLIRCEGRLKNAPLPYDSKTPYLINSEHYLCELIVNYFHFSVTHISIKQTLTEIRQKFWTCRGRRFVRKVLKKCSLCRKYEGPSYQYPATPALTKLRLFD